MRNFSKFIIFIIVIYTFIFTYTNYEFALDKHFFDLDYTTYQIDKPQQELTEDFVSELDKLALDNDLSFFTKSLTYENNQTVTNYYLSSNYELTSPYIKESTEDIIDNYNNKNLLITNQLSNYTLKNISQLPSDLPNTKSINLNIIGDSDNQAKFVSEASQMYDLTQANARGSFSTMSKAPFIIFILLLVLSILYENKKLLREYTIMRTLGYSRNNIIANESILLFKYLLSAYLIYVILSIISLHDQLNLLLPFLIYSSVTLLIIFLIIAILYILFKYYVLLPRLNISYIKGLNKTHFENFCLILLKIFTLSISTILIIAICNDTQTAFNNYQLLSNLSTTYEDYIMLPVNLSGFNINEDLFADIAEFESEFYSHTVDTNNGIIMDATAFSDNDSSNDVLYVNPNFFNMQSLTRGGKLLTADDFNTHQATILYPESYDVSTINPSSLTDLEDVNYLSYDVNQSVMSLNPNTPRELENPLIVVENELDSNFTGRILECYMMQSDNIDKILEEYDTNNYIKQPVSIADQLQINLSTILNQLRNKVLTFIVIILILITTSLFYISNYINQNRKLIFVKKTLGYQNYVIFKSIKLTNTMIYLLILLLTFFLNPSLTTIYFGLLIVIGDIAITSIIINLNQRRINANTIRKY